MLSLVKHASTLIEVNFNSRSFSSSSIFIKWATPPLRNILSAPASSLASTIKLLAAYTVNMIIIEEILQAFTYIIITYIIITYNIKLSLSYLVLNYYHIKLPLLYRIVSSNVIIIIVLAIKNTVIVLAIKNTVIITVLVNQHYYRYIISYQYYCNNYYYNSISNQSNSNYSSNQ